MSSAEPIWTRPAPGERKPAYSRELIVQTAIALADAEGFEAVSMRRLASELGAGTMTLYHYVATKDELVSLIGDAITSELIVPAQELPEGWRDGLAEIARRTRAIFNRHPWIVEHMDEGDPGTAGPNVMRHVEQTMLVTARTGLGHADQLQIAGMVDDYVFGHAMRAAEHRGEDAGPRLDLMLDYFIAQFATGDYPHLQAIYGDDPRGAFERLSAEAPEEERFETGLACLLDGIELWIERRRP
jgi:AcrR family transcriptional regulator